MMSGSDGPERPWYSYPSPQGFDSDNDESEEEARNRKMVASIRVGANGIPPVYDRACGSAGANGLHHWQGEVAYEQQLSVDAGRADFPISDTVSGYFESQLPQLQPPTRFISVGAPLRDHFSGLSTNPPQASSSLEYHLDPDPQNFSALTKESQALPFDACWDLYQQSSPHGSNSLDFDSFWTFCFTTFNWERRDVFATYLGFQTKYNALLLPTDSTTSHLALIRIQDRPDSPPPPDPTHECTDHETSSVLTSRPITVAQGQYPRIAPALATGPTFGAGHTNTRYRLVEEQLAEASLRTNSAASIALPDAVEDKPFKCDILVNGRPCPWSFSKRRALDRHRKKKGHARHVNPNGRVGGVENVCLLHNRGFQGRKDSLLRHLRNQHEESELRQFYAHHGQGGEWVGGLEELYTKVTKLMIQLAPQWLSSGQSEDAATIQ